MSRYSHNFKPHETFATDDLDLHSLRQLGGINVKWTCSADRHLCLSHELSRDDNASENEDVERHRLGTTLEVYWFDVVGLSWLAA